MRSCFCTALLFLFTGTVCTFSQNVSLEGQVSGWVSLAEQEPSKFGYGLRYIPTVNLSANVNAEKFADALFSLNGFISGNAHTLRSIKNGSDVRLYRAWTRYAASQWEIRLGLQKISFGPAILIRPLMWFDRIDPRDPLKLTTGVYGLLFRFYFLNNANIWLWGLYGNGETKGWEFFETRKKTPETGGRIQYPVGRGELALSYHYRRFALPPELMQTFPGSRKDAPEHRIGFDGKWDYEIGLWFEGAYQYQQAGYIPAPHQLMLTYGIDYTFAIGNGLHILGENFLYSRSEKRFGSGPTLNWSSILLNYPLSLLDQAQTIFFYDWDNRNSYSFIGWQRSYDDWFIYLNLFWNPDNPGTFGFVNQSSSVYTGGKGLQILVVFNY